MKSSNRGSLFKVLLDLLPSGNLSLYKFCKNYVCKYNGENDGDIETNGELHFMQQELPKCKTVFDIGANIGDWAKISQQINPKLNLHCFEPSISTFQHLLSNHFSSNVICNNFGFSSKSGKACLHSFGAGSALNSLYKRQGLEDYGISQQQVTETVELKTVDEYCKANGLQKIGIDFCKIDVEGHELEVFKGAKEMLREKAISIIQFEYGGCNIDSRVLLKDIFEFFEQFDYTFYKIFPKKLEQVSRYSQLFENFQYQNWAIIANGNNK